MVLSQEKLERFQRQFPEDMPANAIRALAERLPDDMPLERIMGQMAEIAADLPLKTLPEGEICRRIIWTLQENADKKMKNHPGNPKKIVRDFYDSLLLEMRLMESSVPALDKVLFGHHFSAPVMTAALSHLGVSSEGQRRTEEYALAAKKMNLLHWIGMCENDEFNAIMQTGVKAVRIVKPYADEEKIKNQFCYAEDLGAVAVGMDIDHVFNRKGEFDVVYGNAMASKTLDQMETYRKTTKLPFIVKGVLSVTDAKKCVEIGADGIVLSHHGGRLRYAVPPAMLLEAVREAVGPQISVFIDCGISSGIDAYKALALGADAVGIGSCLLKSLRETGTEGVMKGFTDILSELKEAMAYTGVADCDQFDASVIHRK